MWCDVIVVREAAVPYLLVEPADEHAPGEGLDGDHGLPRPQVLAAHADHAVLLLAHQSGLGEAQLLRMPTTGQRERDRERERGM